MQLAIVSEHLGRQTNNYAEYTGLIRGLQAALTCGVRHIRIKGDSKLVVMQVTSSITSPIQCVSWLPLVTVSHMMSSKTAVQTPFL